MLNVGVQTVLGMSNAAERVQAVAQSGSTLAAEQAKEMMEKQHLAQREEVQNTQKTEEAKIREEDQHKKEQQEREALAQKEEEIEEEETMVEATLAADQSVHGQLLNIKV